MPSSFKKIFTVIFKTSLIENQEFSETTKSTEVGQEPAFVPNYLKNPIFPYGSLQQSSSAHQSSRFIVNFKKSEIKIIIYHNNIGLMLNVGPSYVVQSIYS